MFALRSRQALLLVFVMGLVLVALPAASQGGTTSRAGTIAFLRWPHAARDFSNGPSLFVIRVDGSGLRRLTPPGTSVYSYAWSPDGRLIAYVDIHTLSLWLVRPDGTGRRLLLPNSKLSSFSLSWSPDGKQIAIVSAGPNATIRANKDLSVVIVPVSGAPPVTLPAGRHVGWDVAWSPLGDEIAYENGGIWLIRPDGTGRRQVATVGGGPHWSADGDVLAFGIAVHVGARTDRYRAFGAVNADGTGYHVITRHAYNEYGLAWSPTGRRILYGRADGKGVYVIGADGRGNHRVTPDAPPAAGWGAIAWSPDGSSIVYTTGSYEDTDLYLVGADGRRKVQLTSSPDIDISPSWVAR